MFFSFFNNNLSIYQVIVTKWDDLDITNKIYNLYESYHGKDFEEVFAEIDRITKEAE